MGRWPIRRTNERAVQRAGKNVGPIRADTPRQRRGCRPLCRGSQPPGAGNGKLARRPDLEWDRPGDGRPLVSLALDIHRHGSGGCNGAQHWHHAAAAQAQAVKSSPCCVTNDHQAYQAGTQAPGAISSHAAHAGPFQPMEQPTKRPGKSARQSDAGAAYSPDQPHTRGWRRLQFASAPEGHAHRAGSPPAPVWAAFRANEPAAPFTEGQRTHASNQSNQYDSGEPDPAWRRSGFRRGKSGRQSQAWVENRAQLCAWRGSGRALGYAVYSPKWRNYPPAAGAALSSHAEETLTHPLLMGQAL